MIKPNILCVSLLTAHYTDLVCAVGAIKPMKIFTAVVGLKRKRPVLIQAVLIHISQNIFNCFTKYFSLFYRRDQISYKPSSFIFQPLRRGLIQFTISFVSHFAFYLKHRTEFENELKIIEKYLKIKPTNIKYIQFLFFFIFQKNHNSRHLQCK